MLTVEAATFAGIRSRVVRSEGDEDRAALLFLHGFSDSADGWRRVQRRLATLGHASVAVDQPSHGDAGPLRSGEAVIPQFVEFAADAANSTNGGAPVIVVGNSLGGAHALLLAQHHPELVAGVVAISPAGFDHPRFFEALDDDSRVGQRLRQRRSAQAERETLDPTADDREQSGATPIERFARRALVETGFRALAFGRPWRAPRGFVDDWRAQWRDPDRRRALRALVPQIRDEYIDGDPFDLPSITTPVLALWGTSDRLVLVSSRSTLEAGLPDLEFVELPGIGHMPQLEAPGRTTKHLDEFARRLTAGAAAEP